MKCPVCRGKGNIAEPRNPQMELKLREKTVRELKEKGFGFREIMLIVGYKSTNSISKILKK